jgi:hypothetical protein
MKPMLLRLQNSTNESTWGIGVELGTAGPGLNSTSPEEQRRSRMRAKGYQDWSSSAFEAESKRSRFLGMIE